jgi:hydrogenase expression/formation protein HypC
MTLGATTFRAGWRHERGGLRNPAPGRDCPDNAEHGLASALRSFSESSQVPSMCLGIPGEIVEIDEPMEQGALLQGVVSFGGVRKRICLAYVPAAKVGDYAIVHAGFALDLIDEHRAGEIFATLAEVQRISMATGPDDVLTEAAQGLGGP